MKKWAPYKSLKEQWSTLDNIHEEEKKIEKPTISSEKAEEINELLTNYYGQEIEISFFRNGQINKEKGIIRKVDTFEHKIYLTNRKVISLKEVIDIQNI